MQSGVCYALNIVVFTLTLFYFSIFKLLYKCSGCCQHMDMQRFQTDLQQTQTFPQEPVAYFAFHWQFLFAA